MRTTHFRSSWRAASLALGAMALLAFSSNSPARSEPATGAGTGAPGALVQTAAVPATVEPANAEERRQAAEMLGRQPMSFIRNDGQVDPRVRYYAWRGGFASYFTPEAAMLVFRESPKDAGHPGEAPAPRDEAAGGQGLALALTYLGANPEPRIEGRDRTPGRYNFLVGADPAGWRRDVPGFAGVVYRDLWPGIDMTFHEEEGRLKYSFVVHPGADPDRIRLAYRGAEGLSVREDGALLIATELGTLVDERPVSYQLVDGREEIIETTFRLAEAGEDGRGFGFALHGKVSPGHTLMIDPGLVFSTYLDSTGFDEIHDLALDSADRPVVVGETYSGSFPTTAGAFNTDRPGAIDAFVTKLSADGNALEFSTFLGGGGVDVAYGVALDALDRPVIVGATLSVHFPTSDGAFDTDHNGDIDAFVTQLNADGSDLVFSTFLGGSSGDQAFGVAVDGLNRPFIVGITWSADFPTTEGAFDTGHNGSADAFVAQLSPDGKALALSTYLGGSGFDQAFDVALDGSGRPIVVGQTISSAFPTTTAAFDTGPKKGVAAFVTKLNADGSDLDFSTYLGSDNSVAFGVALDSENRPVVVGRTDSSSFPTTRGAFAESHNGGHNDAFVTKLNADGSDLVFSTFLGGGADERHIGGGGDRAFGVALDSLERPVVVGQTDSPDFPTTTGAFDTGHNGSADAFVTKLSADGSTLVDSTFLGGVGIDKIGLIGGGVALDLADNIYVGGLTCSADFPTTAGAFQETPVGLCAGFVAKFGDEENQPPVADAGPDKEIACTSVAATDVPLDGSGSDDPDSDPLTYTWTNSFGTASGVKPTVSLGLGTSTITLVVNDGVLDSDPDTVDITVFAQVEGLLAPLAALVREGNEPPLPDKAFKQRSTLPLKLRLSCGTQALTDVEVTAPSIVALAVVDEAPVDLETIDPDSGESNDGGVQFRYSEDGEWVYNLSTKDLSRSKVYEITIQMPDGLRHAARFALK